MRTPESVGARRLAHHDVEVKTYGPRNWTAPHRAPRWRRGERSRTGDPGTSRIRLNERSSIYRNADPWRALGPRRTENRDVQDPDPVRLRPRRTAPGGLRGRRHRQPAAPAGCEHFGRVEGRDASDAASAHDAADAKAEAPDASEKDAGRTRPTHRPWIPPAATPATRRPTLLRPTPLRTATRGCP